MPFEHACFVSYRHHEQSELAERFLADLCSALRNELSVMIDEDLYLDRERMRGGASLPEPIRSNRLLDAISPRPS